MTVPKNLAASVRQRLTNVARSNREDFQFVLTRFGLERLLYRVSRSSLAATVLLKGATLFQVWTGKTHRPTRDLDLLGQGEASPERFAQLFREVCELDVEDDGLTFLPKTVRVEPIKEDADYHGLRVTLDARLGVARIPLQIDVGFGDAVTPGPIETTYPTLLDQPAPVLRVYPRETVIAEKFHALVVLGMFNSRMKDFYDLWTLARYFEFQGSLLSEAIQATFRRRRTELPPHDPGRLPLALTEIFSSDRMKLTQWNAFLKKGRLTDAPMPLSDVTRTLTGFLMPPTRAAAAGTLFSRSWKNGVWIEASA